MLQQTNSRMVSGQSTMESFTQDAARALSKALESTPKESEDLRVIALQAELGDREPSYLLSENFQYGNQIIQELIKDLDIKCNNLKILPTVITSRGRATLTLNEPGYTAFIGYEDGHFFPVLVDHTNPQDLKVYNGDSKVAKPENSVESFLSPKFQDAKKKELAQKMKEYNMELYHPSEFLIRKVLEGKQYEIKNNDQDVQRGEGCGPYCVEVIKKIAAQSSLTGLCSALMSGDKELFDSANSPIGRFTQIRSILKKMFASITKVAALDDIKTPMDLLLSTVKEEHRAQVVSTLYELGMGGRNEIEQELFHNIVKNLNLGRILKEENADVEQTPLSQHLARIQRRDQNDMYCGM